MRTPTSRQGGATLIEVLVTILILSFGMLALSGMLAFAVQLPKLSANRAAAMMLAAGHVEKMRANIAGFTTGGYTEVNTYESAVAAVVECVYPACTTATMATADKYQTNVALRRTLTASQESLNAGMKMTCSVDCTSREGDLWIMWVEPSTFAAVNVATSDECPAGVAFTTQPRCVHIKFKL
jgi:type IV pilus assembly protein PilV